MDRGLRGITSGDRSRPVMDHNQRWIASGDGSRQDMDRDWIWMDDMRWMTGDGSQEMDHERRMTVNLLPFHEDIEAIRSYTLLEISYYDFKLRSYHRARICRHTVFQRHSSNEYDAKHYSEHYFEHYSEIPNHAPTCPSSNAEYDPESDPESQLQCRYRTSRTRLIFGGATIFKEGDDSAGFATTLNANNYRTGSAGMKHHETHSPIEKASNGEKCTQRIDGKRTYR